MKLKQIKEFNVLEVTPEIAAKICAIVAWNHLNEERFKNEFTIKQAEDIGILKSGGGSRHPWINDEHSHLYERTRNGVEIDIKCTNQYVRIWKDGHVNCYWKQDLSLSEYEYISRDKNTGKEQKLDKLNYPGNYIKLMQLYLDLGFYTIEK